MKSQIAIEGVLLVLLAAHGWLLFQKSERWSSDLRAVMATRASDQGIVNNATAVDIEGRRIDFARILETRHVAIFLLHGATVTSDLSFWNTVSQSLPNQSKISVIGFCDGSICVNRVKADAPRAYFPVVEYTEVAISQPLLNADDRGDFMILDTKQHFQDLSWRSTSDTVASVLRSILQ